ncbi:MAG TPA: hypothetical protein VFX59_02110, partial [Polyangiales bacterium]|nr:hypothetical protein [Polyangiales bacterium]
CKQGLDNGQYAEALRAADQALAMAGSGDEFEDCKREVNDAMRARSAYEQGVKALAENKLEDAYFLFAGIPDDHDFRSKPEVRSTIERVAQERLVKARKLLRSDPRQTRELASSVLDMQDAPKPARDEAAQLLALASAPVAMAEPNTAPTPKAPKAVVVQTASDDDPAKTARNCLARGDQRCVVRALEGKAENAQELALLIETYRALGETKKAVKHMETFVARYASARQTPQYRQFIAKHEP